MRAFAVLRRHRRALSTGAILTASAVGLSTLAFLYEGIATADLKLDDGGVWVTKSSDLLVGHLNHPSRLLDGAVRTRAGSSDVLQDEERVLVVDSAGGTVTPVDPASVTLGAQTTIPSGSQVALGGTTVAVLADGGVHTLGFDAVAGATFTADAAQIDVGDGGSVAVSSDGQRVAATSSRDASLVVAPAGTAQGGPTTVTLAGLADDADLSVTLVGQRPVAFDRTNGVLFLPDGSAREIPGAGGARLQTTGPDGDSVYLATSTGLLRQSLSGGEAVPVAEVPEGTPSAPIFLGGCTYGVWSGSGAYVRDCPGDADDAQVRIDASPEATLVLRANRRVVVVNDTLAGTVWVVDQDVQMVDNWDEVVPPADDDADEEESQEEQPQFDLPERSAENTPPTAVDDSYGVRAGRTTLLPVTENDTDPDGDLLAASLVGEAPSGYTVSPVLGGASLQVAVPANAQGGESMTYRVDDGRGGSDEASVTIEVRPPDVNEPPQQKRVDTVRVEAGASLTASVLDAWRDPDGDDIYLSGAAVEGGDLITFRSNGVLEFSAASGTVGVKEVKLTVSDGRDSAEGVLRVDVRPAGTLDPVANADRVTATAGVPVTVSPLLNDISPTGELLRLAKHDYPAGATVTPDFAAGTFDFESATPGTYYVQYLVTAGARSTAGIVRIDVVAADPDGLPPVAVRDLALLPTGRSVLVDVLANDSDPSGGILVVQSAKVQPNSGISIEVLEHSVLRVTDLAGLSGPVTASYTVSNGAQSASGEVLIQPVPLPETLRPPVTVEDSVIVRVGDVVSVPVLANDYHPDGDVIVLRPDLVETDVVDRSTIFIDGDRLRFQAGTEPGTVHATYEIEDSQQNRTAGYVTIQVLPADAGTNSPPRAKPVTARVIAGNTVRIPIPLDGIDPDGDSVELVGIASNPTRGTVSVGDTWLTYSAYDQATGRDTFTYTVRDRLGAEAQSTVTVGVAAPGFENQAPYAVKDTVTVKPGRKVAVPVTVNDSDPDGDEIAIDPNGLIAPAGVEAVVTAGRVVVTAPTTPGEYTFTYGIVDAYGASAQGVLLVVVDADSSPEAPIARDDRVPSLAVGEKPTVDVAVLENDEDPDGTVEALTLAVADADAIVVGGIVKVTLMDAPRVVRYSITDEDGLSAQAFIFVPGLATLAPSLMSTEPVLVKSGEKITIPLAEHVHVRPGKTPRIATADSLRASHASGESLLADETTLAYTSAAGYFGPDAIGVLVTDGSGPDDPEGVSGYVSIPIRVLPAENQSPTVRSASLSVAPGEEASVLSLAKLATDPDEGDQEKLTFSVEGDVPAGYRAEVKGSTLEVSADASVVPGTTASIKVRASDGTTAPGEGTVTLNAVVSQRPFPVANDDVIPQANQGEKRLVDVLANDFNPFADRGPLTLVSARVDSGRGDAAVVGDKVEVTPAGDFFGSMIVTYRVADATGSPERQVDGRITLTVQGKPAAPTTPTVTSIQDRTVVLSWGAPANNGAAITGYMVTAPQNYSKQCASTTCTLDGLTNDVEYTFTVVATNSVGDSQPSPSSAPARPDARPDTPAAPTLVFGDKSLQVAWATPRSNGSPVLSYTLEISPAPASGPIQKTGVTGNSLTWEGLQNGVAYQVRVQAQNRAPEPSEWSPYSASVVPAGVPDAPGQPTTTPSSPVGSQAQIAVSWAAPGNANGDPVAGYTLSVKQGGSVVNTIETTSTSQNVVVDTSETDYSFSVTARNKAGSSAASADSAARRGAVAPGAPTNVTAEPRDTALYVSYGAASGNGSRTNELTYRYRINQTGAEGQVPADGVIGGLSNGTAYSVSIWAVSSVEGVQPGPATSSNEVVPFGKPIITLLSIERLDNAVRFRWNVNPNGRGLNQSSYGGAGDNEFTATGLAPDQSYTHNVSYSNEAGQSDASWTGQANPRRGYTVRTGGSGNQWTCPEDADGTGLHYNPNGPSCSSGWLAGNTDYEVACYVDWSKKNVSGNYRWYRLITGKPDWYLAAGTTTNTNGSGIPAC